MKIKHSFLLWGLVFLLFVSCGEKQNYLSGQIEGLEPGDCIILGLIDPITDEIYISDSTIVEKKNHFDLYTKATDQWAYLAHCPKNEKIKIEHHRGNRFRFFLEGYASLHLSGSTDNFHYLKITGGLYETPDLRPAFNLMDSALLIQQDGIGRSPSDPLRRTLIKQSNRMLMTIDSMEQQFADTHPDFAYSAAIIRYVNEKELEKTFPTINATSTEKCAGHSGQQSFANISIDSTGWTCSRFYTFITNRRFNTTIGLQRETRIFGILGVLVRTLPHDVS